MFIVKLLFVFLLFLYFFCTQKTSELLADYIVTFQSQIPMRRSFTAFNCNLVKLRTLNSLSNRAEARLVLPGSAVATFLDQ